MQQPVIAFSDIEGDMRQEVMDTIVSGVDKFGTDLESAAKSIKETLDKQYGLTWQIVIGKGFAFDIVSLEWNCMHCYYQGDVGILAFKTGGA
jgi:dynein light chain 4